MDMAILEKDHTGLFDCCYTRPGVFLATMCFPFACCVLQGYVVQETIDSRNESTCLGPCALVSTTFCIGYAMNRMKIFNEAFDPKRFAKYVCIGIFAMPCGVTQEWYLKVEPRTTVYEHYQKLM